MPAEDRDLLRLGEDFPDLEGAAATNLPVMTSDVGKMRLGMQRLDGWLKRASEEGDVAFVTTAGDFYHAKKPVFDALEQKFKDMKAAFADLCGPSTISRSIFTHWEPRVGGTDPHRTLSSSDQISAPL